MSIRVPAPWAPAFEELVFHGHKPVGRGRTAGSVPRRGRERLVRVKHKHGRYVVLCGGLGGSRFVDALAQAAGHGRVTAVVNVADDVEILGLHVSPDLDTVLYTLAGLLDEDRGWGVQDETYGALELAERLGGEAGSRSGIATSASISSAPSCCARACRCPP